MTNWRSIHPIVDTAAAMRRLRGWSYCNALFWLSGCCSAVNPIGKPTPAELTETSPVVFQISSVTTTFEADDGNDVELLRCLVIELQGEPASAFIRLDCPGHGFAKFPLRDLNAEVCTSTWQCAPVEGTLDVRFF